MAIIITASYPFAQPGNLSLVGDVTGTGTTSITTTVQSVGGSTAANIHAAEQLANGSSFVTLTGSQTLTNKTLTTPIIAAISNTGTLALPTSNDTLVGRATTDTLTNKTLTAPAINQPVIGGLTDGSSAGAGIVNQVISSSVLFASRASISSNTETNVTSISVTAGRWMLFGNVGYLPAGSTSVTQFSEGISLTTAAMPASSTLGVPSGAGEFSIVKNMAAAVPASTYIMDSLSGITISVNATTTFYLVARTIFTISTMEAWGGIRAVRIG